METSIFSVNRHPGHQIGGFKASDRFLAPLPLSLFGEAEDETGVGGEQSRVFPQGLEPEVVDDDEFGDFESVPAGLSQVHMNVGVQESQENVVSVFSKSPGSVRNQTSSSTQVAEVFLDFDSAAAGSGALQASKPLDVPSDFIPDFKLFPSPAFQADSRQTEKPVEAFHDFVADFYPDIFDLGIRELTQAKQPSPTSSAFDGLPSLYDAVPPESLWTQNFNQGQIFNYVGQSEPLNEDVLLSNVDSGGSDATFASPAQFDTVQGLFLDFVGHSSAESVDFIQPLEGNVGVSLVDQSETQGSHPKQTTQGETLANSGFDSDILFPSAGEYSENLSDDDWGEFVAPPPPVFVSVAEASDPIPAVKKADHSFDRDLLDEQTSAFANLSFLDGTNFPSNGATVFDVRKLSHPEAKNTVNQSTHSQNADCGSEFTSLQGDFSAPEVLLHLNNGHTAEHNSEKCQENGKILEADISVKPAKELPIFRANHHRSKSLFESGSGPLPPSLFGLEETFVGEHVHEPYFGTRSRPLNMIDGSFNARPLGRKSNVPKALLSRSKSLIEKNSVPVPLSLFGEEDIFLDIDFELGNSGQVYTKDNGFGSFKHMDINSEEEIPSGISNGASFMNDSIPSATSEEDFHKIKLHLIAEGRVTEALGCAAHASALQSLTSLKESLSETFRSGELEKGEEISKLIEIEKAKLAKPQEVSQWQVRQNKFIDHPLAATTSGTQRISKLTINDMLKLLGGSSDRRGSVFEEYFSTQGLFSLANRDVRAAAEHHAYAAETFQVLVSATTQDQLLYVKAWSALVSVCADEMELGSRFWQQAVLNHVHSELLSFPKGRNYFASLGQVYVVYLVLQATIKLHEPWLKVAGEQGRAVSSAVDLCHSCWVSSGLKEAVYLSLSVKRKGIPGTNTTWENILDIRNAVTTAATKGPAIIAAEYQAQPVCGLSLLPLLLFSEASLVEWENRKYLLPVANMWANCVQSKPPNLPVL